MDYLYLSVTGLREVVDAGAELVVLDPLDGDPALLERLIDEVVPAVALT